MHSAAVREQALALIQAGLNDCEIARRTGIARTTVRDWRRPPKRKPDLGPPRPQVPCARCWLPSSPMSFSTSDYAELLALYLGDGHVVRVARTFRLRLYLDSRHREIVASARELLERCFKHNAVGVLYGHQGRMTILSVYSSHIGCLLPQHGPGLKHNRRILLEGWQAELINEAPWSFLRGCIWSDGCSFINRTGPYEYLSYDFFNCSRDILDLFCEVCDSVGVEYRRYAKRIRIYRRASVALMEANVGIKR